MKNKNKIYAFATILSFFFLLPSCNLKLNEVHPQVTKGDKLFQKYCLECHASDGKGIESLKGHYNKLDLTRINMRRDLDEFPVVEIAKYIDGRNHYKEFGPRSMPMWGVDLMAKENQYDPDTARSNLGAIISYLITMQE